jgi:hypothetical protein
LGEGGAKKWWKLEMKVWWIFNVLMVYFFEEDRKWKEGNFVK